MVHYKINANITYECIYIRLHVHCTCSLSYSNNNYNSVYVQCRYSKTNFMTVETRLDMNKQEEVHASISYIS